MMELARAVKEKLADERVAGAVVTHGTDTLEETAYLLDLVLNDEKPVVFVGAMRNSSELSWDGPANLRSAVRVAIDPAARGLGVIVVMNDQLIAAAEVTKTHTESTDTFQSRDFGPLGLVDKDRVIVTRRRLEREHIAINEIEERPVNVDVIKMYAGADGRFINFAIDDGARGLVIEALGRGNVTPAALPAIARAIEMNIPVVITSRCPRGRALDTYAYEGAGRQLRKMGAILGGMLPCQKARIKLTLALGAGWGVERIRGSFEK
jgi:L-asparaginase